ncbi:hypothetical protein [Streptomyces sp. NBC_01006]|uniref:hypothetical protein n=1 Tax=Streptomyces sp. NBC_01006 TaxID=2903716 RepID=UPI0038663273|nr:hypothetical protein OG509_35330 [Streptomyces sp. NBC_01006]
MNDPIPLAATQDDGPRELPDPDPDPAPEPTGATPPAPPADPASTAPIRTLLETAGTCRPLKEVAELVSLLEETGQSPGHGHQTLRAAAVGRPVQDVALLVGILGTDEDREPPPDPAPTAQSPEPVHPGPVAGSPQPVPAAPAAPAAPVVPVVPAVPSVHPAQPPHTSRPARPPAVPTVHAGSPARDGQRSAQRPEPPEEEPFDDPYEDEPYESLAEYRRKYGRGPYGNPAAVPAPSGPLRHLLRWPVAAALLVCGVLHLPSDVTALSTETPTAFLPLLAAVLCLGLGALIAVHDSAGAWRAAAVAAVAVVALHVVGGIAAFDPLEGAVSASQAWAGVAAVFCAAAAAVLAGLALGNRSPRARAGAGG